MPRRGRRIRIEEGIFRDSIGYEVIVGNGGKGNSHRYTFDDPLSRQDLATMRRWRLRRKAEIAQAGNATKVAPLDTLRADVPRVLALYPKGQTRDDLEQLLDAWLHTPLASRRRSDLTREDVKGQLAAWGSAGGRSGKGYAASTLNHRAWALRTLFKELDGDDGPTADIAKFKEPDPEPRGVPFAIAEAVIAAIKDRGGKNKPVLITTARIRLEVHLFTGIPPAQIKRILPAHINWDAPSILVMKRKKGKGVSARRLPLLPQAVEALRRFDQANLYGPYSTDAVRWVWNRAKVKVAEGVTDPAVKQLILSLTPYDLRHSFLSAVYEHSGDHRAASELGLHADERTTRRYTLAAVGERARLALAAFPGTKPNQTPDQTVKKTEGITDKDRTTGQAVKPARKAKRA